MIHPSYVDLMNTVNRNVAEGEAPVVNSRYSIVMATAKRARQIVDGCEPRVACEKNDKPLSIAVDELEHEQFDIIPRDEAEIEKLEDEKIEKTRALEYAAADDVVPTGASLMEDENAEAETEEDPEQA